MGGMSRFSGAAFVLKRNRHCPTAGARRDQAEGLVSCERKQPFQEPGNGLRRGHAAMMA
nr:hypothetical protein SHINE37_44228 [Rhizobiaceae bacterium]